MRTDFRKSFARDLRRRKNDSDFLDCVISGRGVSDCRERGKKILDKPEIIGEYLA